MPFLGSQGPEDRIFRDGPYRFYFKSQEKWSLSCTFGSPQFIMHFQISASILFLAISAANAQLNRWARASGKQYFGTATDNYELADAPYFKQLSNTKDFAQITPV